MALVCYIHLRKGNIKDDTRNLINNNKLKFSYNYYYLNLSTFTEYKM